jgi:hypothetical protein
MMRGLAIAFLALSLVAGAHAQTALAPWFDSDGFYNRPDADLARVTSDLTTCRAEAARLKIVRNTSSQVGSAAAFNADGSYNPVISGAATGIASIMFAIQDARYNGSIEQIEFRDCAVALGFRHYRLSERDRARFDAEADHGFATLVSASTPADGRLNQGENERNYYSSSLIAPGYQNAAPPPANLPAAESIADPPPESIDQPLAALNELERLQEAPSQTALQSPAAGIVSRLGSDAVTAPQPGMAIIVASARQQSGSMQIPVPGDTFKFRRVTSDGQFVDLLQPSISFALRTHFNPERRTDPSLRGAYNTPRYSTYQVPAGRYVLSDIGALNACLGTLTFEIFEGEVVFLGDFVLHPPGLPTGSLFNPLGNINSGMDNNLRDDLRVGIGDDLEAARQALQADAQSKASLKRVFYQNNYRIACDGRYIGRIANAEWPSFDPAQTTQFHDALAAAIAASE